ncbi:MAG: hypothetical protein H6765_05445 [Candidatus Peribacteria bacterium]|nr:MAG: hypothetical protein H6765_05445 [Candidatus Peribacteria bacterium]
MELQHNAIEEIVGVETLNNLEKIKLEFNKLKDLSFLDSLQKLVMVSAKGNEVADALLEKWNKLNEAYVQQQKAPVSGDTAE